MSAPSTQTLINVKGLTKYYDDFPAIKDISFQISAGSVVGLLGLNGAGKSTVLKILGTFLTPSYGEARVNGHSVEEDGDAVRAMIGYLPDKPPLYDEMTARDYLYFVAALKGVAEKERTTAVNDALRDTNTVDVADVRLGMLSHGYRQRIGIAQAIVHRPKLLILDEPINGLDPIQIVEMRDLIVSLKGRHTVILSSHILSEITKTCDLILVIDKGRLVAQGHPSDLLHRGQGHVSVTVEFANKSAWKPDGLKNLPWIKNVSAAADLGAHAKATIEMSEDRRSELLKTLLSQGVDVLSFAKSDDGLESVFMGLVKKEGHH